MTFIYCILYIVILKGLSIVRQKLADPAESAAKQRSNHHIGSIKKVFLKISQNPQEDTSVKISIF